MLYQDIIDNLDAHPFTRDGHGRAIAEALLKASRHAFDDNATAAMTQLALSKPSRIYEARQFLRLPFPEGTWIEYPDPVRKRAFRDLGGELTPGHRHPSRTGLLAWEDRDEPGVVNLWTAWTMPPPTLAPFHFTPFAVRMKLSLEGEPVVDPDAVRGIIEETPEETFGRTSFLFPVRGNRSEIDAYVRFMAFGRNALCPLVDQEVVRRMQSQFVTRSEMEEMADRWRRDVGQEVMFLVAALLLLNSRNAVERETVEYEKLNRRREKQGKPPIRDHVVVRLRLPKGEMGTGSRSQSARAAHWVKGHPKLRKTGLFWWSPFVRNRPSGGPSPAIKDRIVKG